MSQLRRAPNEGEPAAVLDLQHAGFAVRDSGVPDIFSRH
jgi:hypothetical protein